jgi:hypothetical protein
MKIAQVILIVVVAAVSAKDTRDLFHAECDVKW